MRLNQAETAKRDPAVQAPPEAAATRGHLLSLFLYLCGLCTVRFGPHHSTARSLAAIHTLRFGHRLRHRCLRRRSSTCAEQVPVLEHEFHRTSWPCCYPTAKFVGHFAPLVSCSRQHELGWSLRHGAAVMGLVPTGSVCRSVSEVYSARLSHGPRVGVGSGNGVLRNRVWCMFLNLIPGASSSC